MYQQTMEELELLVTPETSSLLTRIGHFLAEEGTKSYLVGGFVRDMLLKRETADIDIAVADDALQVAARAAAAMSGRYIPLDEENRIARVVLINEEASPTGDKWQLDFSTITGNIEQDLAQRDFTIDAMALELGEEATFKLSMLIDPFQGHEDLHQGIIRAVSRTGFQSDAARLLRAVRLAAEFGFSIDMDTEALIRQDCHLISGVAGERTREELLRLLTLPKAAEFLSYLENVGLLTAIIPELELARGVSQPFVHFWDVLDHSIQTAAAVDFILRRGSWQYGSEDILAFVPWTTTLQQHFNEGVGSGSTRGSLLRLAALLHDIAKPQTRSVDEDGRARFLGHARDGATMTSSILERLRFSSREIKLVGLMVEQHMRPGQMSQCELPSRRSIYRFFRDTGETGIDILFLNLADHLATRGPLLDMALWQEHVQTVAYILEKQAEEESLVLPPKLIDGHDLINIFGMQPGPEIGALLEALHEAQAAGEVTSRDEAVAYIRHLLVNPEPENNLPGE